MKVLLATLKTVSLFIILTVVTQLGGLVYLLYKPLGDQIKKRSYSRGVSLGLRAVSFLLMMTISSLLVVPPLAKKYGRVPLPVFSNKNISLQPGSWFTILTNRHYVKPKLKQTIIEVSQELNRQYPGTKILYLDANFPFLTGFPLLPHKSHDDGEKLDIAFLYKNRSTGQRIHRTPTLLGYGYCEKPLAREYDQAAACAKQGYWQYSLLKYFAFPKAHYQFDEQANRFLIRSIADKRTIGKIFIEPHLKSRLGFGYHSKVRNHGCAAVRHDDHIHLQL